MAAVKFLFVLVILALFSKEIRSDPSCGVNERFEECGPCDSTCEEERACAAICRLQGGCGCETDFVRHNGVCIHKSRCP